MQVHQILLLNLVVMEIIQFFQQLQLPVVVEVEVGTIVEEEREDQEVGQRVILIKVMLGQVILLQLVHLKETLVVQLIQVGPEWVVAVALENQAILMERDQVEMV